MGEMDFSEAVKLEVKQKAGFQCCRCHEFGVEIHHILPKELGGYDDIDNAAPLCPNCHSFFGANPDKRKEIKQMRDWWYQRIEQMYPDNRQKAELEDISNKVDKILQRQISPDELKQALFKYNQESYNRMNELISNMTMGTVTTTASAIVNIQLTTAELHASGGAITPHAMPVEKPELKDDFSA